MGDKKNRVYKTFMLVVLTAFVTFMLTLFAVHSYYNDNMLLSFGNTNEAEEETKISSSSDLEKKLKKIKTVINKYYLWSNEIDEEELERGAIKGYVKALGDEYTEYVPANSMDEYTETITGSFVGIGIYMTANESAGRVVVYYPIQGSPAEKAGIMPGDLIISVDGKEYTSDDFDIIPNYIKGEAGTTVNIVIERDGERKSFDIKREKININPNTTKIIENNIGYIKIPSFDENTAKDFENNIKDLQSQGAEKIIIDVRNNGGGIVDVATEIADSLLKKNLAIMSTVDKSEKKETTYSKKDAEFTMPIVLLVNENSASASEILACSLQDNERATVVGTKTYGKGVIQTFLTLSDGSGLKITTEEYYTPNGKTINKVGIMPNEEVKLPENVKNVYSVKEEEDTQLKKAIEILKSQN